MTDTNNTNEGKQRTVRIGGASGFWGDSSMGAPQLVKLGSIDYLVFDYLAELTMSILAAQRMKKPDAGFALDFVAITLRQVLKDCVAKNIKIISNAGGVNPQACAAAAQAVATELGLNLNIAVVLGDDVLPLTDELRDSGTTEFKGKRALPDKLLTANAYLGALPIKRALDAGAQLVITGRCVDSAVTLGALMHEFNWSATDPSDLNKLAQGSLAGHIIECGAQGTGGLFTDWQDVPNWEGIGYPIVECSSDGSFIATKPRHTGGLVTPAVIAEQMLYEIGDPSHYMLPDVVCDFTQVLLTSVGEHQVRVTGANGKPPSPFYKVSSTSIEGFKATVQLAIIGFDAAAKARRTGEALLARTSHMLSLMGLAPYSSTHLEILGTENAYGPHSQIDVALGSPLAVREAIVRLAVRHPVKQALELFSREIAAPGTSFSAGTTGMDGGRPSVNPAIVQFAFLLHKSRVTAQVLMGDAVLAVDIPIHEAQAPSMLDAQEPQTRKALGMGAQLATFDAGSAVPFTTETTIETTELPLIAIAHGRSGDKGDTSNIGIVARHADLLPLIEAQVTEASVAAYLAHFVKGRITRYALPGIGAFNFVCEQALGGGGMASMRHDPLGKAMAQILLSMPVKVPRALAHRVKSRDALLP